MKKEFERARARLLADKNTRTHMLKGGERRVEEGGGYRNFNRKVDGLRACIKCP